MTLGNIYSIEQVFVGIIVKVSAKRLVVELFCTCSKNLVGSNWCPLGFLLDNRLLLRLRWRCKVDVAVEAVLLEFNGLYFHSLDLLEILLVI